MQNSGYSFFRSLTLIVTGLDADIDADVGYANYTVSVINMYFTEYFPRAIAIANGLRAGGYVETFIYTTHAWLVSLYLDCPPHLVLNDGIQLKVSWFARILQIYVLNY